jgi:anti-sigma B factor antagonist
MTPKPAHFREKKGFPLSSGQCYLKPMELSEIQDGPWVILHLKGDIDLQHSPKLRTHLQTKIQAKTPALLVNFTEVNYIDSSGLATLVAYFQGSRPYDGKIALAGLSPRVKSVFDLVRLNEVFPIFPSLEEAKASLTP